MSKSLTVKEPKAVSAPAQGGGIIAWLQDTVRRQLYKDTYCKGASDLECELLFVTAANSKLDPLKRQIFLVPRWDSKLQKMVYTPQTSIDGFRVGADRTGMYRGQLGPFWCGKDGVWKEVWLESGPPAAAKVGVIHANFQEPLFAVARFDAYAQTNKDGKLNPMWGKMGDLMLAKCAEALALRKAFPDELGGLYTQEEMGQATHVEEVHTAAPTVITATKNPLQENREQKEAVSNEPGTYVITFGKWKGQTLSEVDLYELNSYCNYIQKQAEADNKPIKGQVATFLEAAGNFIATRDVTEDQELPTDVVAKESEEPWPVNQDYERDAHLGDAPRNARDADNPFVRSAR